jgi:hypothetical protein
MVDDGILAVIGAAIVGFGIVAFVFRIQRELDRYRPKDRWIPWADRLLIGIVIVALLFVLFPIALAETFSDLWGKRLPAAAASASAIALAGYIPALLAHYRFGPRYRPVKGKEPVYDEGGPSPPRWIRLRRLGRHVFHFDPRYERFQVKRQERHDKPEHDQRGPYPRKWIWFGPLLRGKLRAGQAAEKVIVIASVALGLIAAMLSFVVTS